MVQMFPPGPSPAGPAPVGPENPGADTTRRGGVALAALVLGGVAIVSFWTVIGGVLFGLLAVVFGAAALRTPPREVFALVGVLLGVVATAAAVALAIIGSRVFAAAGGGEFLDCTRRAGNDQAAITVCEQQWNQRFHDRYGITLTPGGLSEMPR